MVKPTTQRRILIVGGGTAGWMTAALLQHRLGPKGFSISLIESSDIPTVGVGEGSTPQLKTFFDILGIKEQEWMPACNATFKNGIRFNHWTVGKNNDSYFHPFPSVTDRETAREFLLNCHLARQGKTVAYHPDDYFLAGTLAAKGKSPITDSDQAQLSFNYAYHFDAGKLAEFLKKRVLAQGVTHIIDTIKHVDVSASGQIASVITATGKLLAADWFFDCSGFSGLLIQKVLNTPFKSFKDNLFNNAAIAIPTAKQSIPLAQTTANAQPHGWSWHIPLTHRMGNGYVFSTDFCDFDQAETELRQHLGLLDSAVEARHIHMNVGRCENSWVSNCIAVGLAQGFIEPLEATALHIVQETITQFIGAFEAGQYSKQHQAQFNQVINQRIDGIRDYIVCHYKASNRDDTEYWRANRNNTSISQSLQSILHVWHQGGDVNAEILRQNIGHYYPAISWYCLLSGYGVGLAPSSGKTNPVIQQHINALCEQFTPHTKALRLN